MRAFDCRHVAGQAQQSADVADGQDGDVRADACAGLEPNPFILVKPSDEIDRRLRFLHEKFDGASIWGFVVSIAVYGHAAR